VKLTILASVAILLPAASWAADVFDVKPGLWETTSTTDMGNMAAMPQIPADKLAQLPPDQRARIEAMMKGRSGTPTVTKVCMTKESLAKALNFSQNNNSCTQKVTSLSSTKQEIHTECTGQFKGAGDLIIERVDSEHAKGEMVMKGDSGRGTPISMKMSFTTKYLGADCGDVKPMGEK
jgi:hypothetical protein